METGHILIVLIYPVGICVFAVLFSRYENDPIEVGCAGLSWPMWVPIISFILFVRYIGKCVLAIRNLFRRPAYRSRQAFKTV